MKKIVLIVFLFIGLLSSCNYNSPTPKPKVATEYDTCIVEQYGKAYQKVENHVLALDLYSKGLTLDSLHKMVGSGTNLYISDIFLPLDSLQTGEYVSDTTTASYTFLPGKDFEGNPTGMYLLVVSDGTLSSIQVFDSGRVQISEKEQQLEMQFTLYYGRKTYQAHYLGPVGYYDKR